MNLHAVIDAVTDRIRKRSRDSREVYLAGIASMQVDPDSDRRSVSCSNMAHAAAAQRGAAPMPSLDAGGERISATAHLVLASRSDHFD